jgi:hypothetical protein
VNLGGIAVPYRVDRTSEECPSPPQSLQLDEKVGQGKKSKVHTGRANMNDSAPSSSETEDASHIQAAGLLQTEVSDIQNSSAANPSKLDRLDRLKFKVEKSPWDVDSWTSYIQEACLRQDPSYGRDAYEAFLKQFPTSVC